MDSLEQTVHRLSDASRRDAHDPYTTIDWPDEIDRNNWFTSPKLVSLYGTDAWEALSDSDQKDLAFWECVNFFSINIHGEKTLMEGIAHRLYAPKRPAVSEYLHHFLDEENKHSIWFGTFCEKYGHKIYADKKLALGDGENGEVNDFMFFARVMVFEEIVDRFNFAMSKDEQLDALARQINANHHAEETRHLVFGRQFVRHLWSTFSPNWDAQTLASIREYLSSYFLFVWREYYNPDVYRDAGFSDPYAASDTAFDSDYSRQLRADFSKRAIEFLLECEILDERPPL